MSTSQYCLEKIAAQEEQTISDASSLVHLEEIISENLFTVPAPYIEATAKPTPPLFLRIRPMADRVPLFNDPKLPARVQTNVNGSKSENISARFDSSAHYYVFALRHIII